MNRKGKKNSHKKKPFQFIESVQQEVLNCTAIANPTQKYKVISIDKGRIIVDHEL